MLEGAIASARMLGWGLDEHRLDFRLGLHSWHAALTSQPYKGHTGDGVLYSEAEGMVLHPRRPPHIPKHQHNCVHFALFMLDSHGTVLGNNKGCAVCYIWWRAVIPVVVVVPSIQNTSTEQQGQSHSWRDRPIIHFKPSQIQLICCCFWLYDTQYKDIFRIHAACKQPIPARVGGVTDGNVAVLQCLLLAGWCAGWSKSSLVGRHSPVGTLANSIAQLFSRQVHVLRVEERHLCTFWR
jgi:hypothetical protein